MDGVGCARQPRAVRLHCKCCVVCMQSAPTAKSAFVRELSLMRLSNTKQGEMIKKLLGYLGSPSRPVPTEISACLCYLRAGRGLLACALCRLCRLILRWHTRASTGSCLRLASCAVCSLAELRIFDFSLSQLSSTTRLMLLRPAVIAASQSRCTATRSPGGTLASVALRRPCLLPSSSSIGPICAGNQCFSNVPFDVFYLHLPRVT